MASNDVRVRDTLPSLVTTWLSDRVQNGRTVGFRVLRALVMGLDALLDMAVQGLDAWFGFGTPTALPLLGRSRGILRGRSETQAEYATRLRAWLETWPEAGSSELIALSIHQYLGTNPTVRIIQRGEVIGGVLQPSKWVTCESDGTITRTSALWNWDTISHPARSDAAEPYWSDEWIVIQTSPFAERSGTLGSMTGEDGHALGHAAAHAEVDAVHGLVGQWKGGHSCVSAVIWTTDATLFDPTDPSTCPNGRWGAWGMYDGSLYVPSSRNTTTCRYWEPR